MNEFEKEDIISLISKILFNLFMPFQLVMSSDKLANIKEPLSELHFELKTTEGEEQVSLELDKEELKMLIDKMEAANKVS